ncbi:MAG TPA: hypothetical protein VE619_11915 [Nitrososphaeraceae archaeon]|nr:hypothetical protein [Nitrososphaeraceae archaeon]
MTTKYTTIIRIIIATLAISMLVAGPNMALLKQHQGHAAPQTKKKSKVPFKVSMVIILQRKALLLQANNI